MHHFHNQNDIECGQHSCKEHSHNGEGHHHHHHHHDHHVDAKDMGTVYVVAVVLNLLFVVIEAVAGFVGHSMGLLSDAGHNMSDVFCLLLAMVALRLSQTKATKRFTYGYRKSSVLISLLNAIILLVAVGGIITVLIRNIVVLEFGFSQTAGSFLGAAVVGLIALKAIHWFHTPNIVITIPSAIPMIPGVLLYRLLFALLNLDFITTEEFFISLRSGINAVTIIIGIAVGVAIPNIFIHRQIERRKQDNVHKLLAKRYAESED